MLLELADASALPPADVCKGLESRDRGLIIDQFSTSLFRPYFELSLGFPPCAVNALLSITKTQNSIAA